MKMRYKRNELIKDLKLINDKNVPIKAMFYGKKGDPKELHIWGLAVNKKRKYIEICLMKKLPKLTYKK